jgi:hypothetical protein
MVAGSLFRGGTSAFDQRTGLHATPTGPHPWGRIRSIRPVVGGRRPAPSGDYLLGWGVTRRYGLTDLNPLGNRSLASSSETAGTMITSSPSVQFTGVATL